MARRTDLRRLDPRDDGVPGSHPHPADHRTLRAPPLEAVHCPSVGEEPADRGGASYCRLLLSNLSTILSAAVEDGLIASNPCAVSSVKAPRVDRRRVVPWTVETVQAVIENHPDEFLAVPVLGAGCGLRQGEIFGLSVDGIDFLRRVVHVRQQLRLVENQVVLAPPKGGGSGRCRYPKSSRWPWRNT